MRRLADLPWQGQVVEIRRHARRFRCADPQCPRRIFTERLPETVQPKARRTVRLGESQLAIGFAAGGEPGSRLSDRLAMPASGDTLLRMIRAAGFEPPQAPRVVGTTAEILVGDCSKGWAYLARFVTSGTLVSGRDTAIRKLKEKLSPRAGGGTCDAGCANRSVIWKPYRPPATAIGTGPSRAVCTSLGNADSTNAVTQLVRITHPFHPLFSRLLPCVGRRYNRHGERLLLQADDTAVWSVPPQWTDLANPDPEVVMGNGRALLRTVDLLELASLVGRLSGKSASRSLDKL
ncbi:DUF5372 family protein [Mesorhizobium sp. M0809]